MGHSPKFISTLLSLTLALSSCLYLGQGTNTLIKESSNNLHKKKAILFLHQGGATVGDSYHISILDYDYKFGPQIPVNTFTVDTNHGNTGLNSTSINLTWSSNDSLLIDYDKKLRTFRQETNVQGVTVIYKAR